MSTLSVKHLVTVLVVLSPLQISVAQTQSFPACASQSSDPDGDGYGWENGTCLVAHGPHANVDCSTDRTGTPEVDSVTHTHCEVLAGNLDSLDTDQADNCIDTEPLHDGWGWNGYSACRVASTQEPSSENTPAATQTGTTIPITPTCIDTEPLHDGWGWNGYSSCRIASTVQLSSENTTSATQTGATETTSLACIDTTTLSDVPLSDEQDSIGSDRCSVSSIKTQNRRTPFQQHGKLTVCKKDNYSLCDQYGQPVQLTGMSSHGIHWSGWHTYDRGGCLTEDSMDLLSQTWNIDIFRIAMYVKYGGYESSPEETIRHVNTVIAELSDRGLYVIVDFHILAGTGVSGNPLNYTNTAETFFRRIVQDNKHRQNVLYEIANEPQASDLIWDHIKQYGDSITKAIREEENNDNHAVIVVGTNSWSSFGLASNGNFFEIVNNPVDDSAGNLMYAFHFYANDPSHISRGYIDALSQAVHHIPVFVTEWGTQDASGGGTNDFGRAREYVRLMQQKNISWTMWNFSDAEESSAIWNDTSFCSQNKDWRDTSNLSETGHFIKGIFDEY